MADSAATEARYELGLTIGPCTEEACAALMGAILDLPEAKAVFAGAVGSTKLSDDD